MKFRLISDTHNYCDPTYRLHRTETENEEILLLAGDIDDNKNERLKVFLQNCSSRFKEVVYISGNHEYYGSNIIRNHEKLKEICSEFGNVHYLNNQSYTVGDVVIIGCTLWTNLTPIEQLRSNCMNDYNKIRNGSNDMPFKRKLTPQDTTILHKESISFIKNTLANTSKKTIILTHHAPSYKSIDPRYKEDSTNCFYATDLEQIIREYKPNAWVHGHIHTFFDYTIDTTRIMCNPKGYDSFQGREYTGYDDIFTFEI